ncbi:MAG: hypothetical protein ACNA8W_24625, partial [Bradymonadaceae bacterium]
EDNVWEAWLPAAMAVLLAPKLRGTRPSLPLLLGKESPERIAELAATYGIDERGSRVEIVLGLTEKLCEPGIIDTILELLPDPEWIAAGLMILELGGLCYWQEIFGYDLEETASPDRKVIPLMRSHERTEEQAIAKTLLDLGIIFRAEDENSPYPLVAVPEELWASLWQLGRDWLMEWTTSAYYSLGEQGVGRGREDDGLDLQSTFKWLILEADKAPLEVPGPEPSEASFAHLRDVAGQTDEFLRLAVDIGLEMQVLMTKGSALVAGPEHKVLLDLPRPAFIRQVLYEWCTGFAASHADAHLAQAVGLDDTWRRRMLGVLEERVEFVPTWMRYEGVPSHTTGAGVLRAAESGNDELLLLEMGFVMGFVWMIKLVWLDLLSMLEGGRWYPVGAITEMFQMVSCLGLFSQLVHLLDHPHLSLYLPVQRASFFTDAFHSTHFRTWTGELINDLLVPLGVASLSEDGEMVWLETRHLRIQSPPGWPDDQRVALLAELFGQDEVDFRIPNGRAGLLQVASDVSIVDGRLSLDGPIDELRQSLAGHKVKRFDGKHIFVD